jgi:hypothetical protein
VTHPRDDAMDALRAMEPSFRGDPGPA